GVVFSITEDTSHNIWARITPRLVRITNLKVAEESTTPVIAKGRVLVADTHEGIWMSLPGGVLAHYNQGQLKEFKPGGQEGTHDIVAMVVEADGSVLGATDHGVVRLKDGNRTMLSSRNGLPCDEIYTLVEDNFGALWLYSKCGLVQIESAELQKWYQQPT